MSTIDSVVLEYLCDPKVRRVAVPHLQRWMFSDPYDVIFMCMSDDKHAGKLFEIKSFLIDLHTRFGAPEKVCQMALGIIRNGQTFTDSEAKEAINSLNTFVEERLLARGLQQYAQADSPHQRQQGKDNIQRSLNQNITVEDFTLFDTNETIELAREDDFPAGGKIIRSTFSVFNTNRIIGGFKYGDIIMYAARTGVGKTTAMIQEGAGFIDQGYRVGHLCLGDMTEFDLFLQYLTVWSGKTATQVMSTYETLIRTGDYMDKFQQVRIKAVQADVYTVHDVITMFARLKDKFEYDAIIIDYDSNILQKSDNMYQEGGTTYGLLKGFSKGHCLCAIGSQIKPYFWGHEIVPLEAPVESSKKQFHIDGMLAFGPSTESRRVGTLNIPKMRKGNSDVQVRIFFNYPYSRLEEITTARYEEIKQEHAAERQMEITGVEIDNFDDEN